MACCLRPTNGERDSGRVLLGRDRLGIKPPLRRVPGGLRFASTLPALLAAVGSIHPSIQWACTICHFMRSCLHRHP